MRLGESPSGSLCWGRAASTTHGLSIRRIDRQAGRGRNSRDGGLAAAAAAGAGAARRVCGDAAAATTDAAAAAAAPSSGGAAAPRLRLDPRHRRRLRRRRRRRGPHLRPGAHPVRRRVWPRAGPQLCARLPGVDAQRDADPGPRLLPGDACQEPRVGVRRRGRRGVRGGVVVGGPDRGVLRAAAVAVAVDGAGQDARGPV